MPAEQSQGGAVQLRGQGGGSALGRLWLTEITLPFFSSTHGTPTASVHLPTPIPRRPLGPPRQGQDVAIGHSAPSVTSHQFLKSCLPLPALEPSGSRCAAGPGSFLFFFFTHGKIHVRFTVLATPKGTVQGHQAHSCCRAAAPSVCPQIGLCPVVTHRPAPPPLPQPPRPHSLRLWLWLLQGLL